MKLNLFLVGFFMLITTPVLWAKNLTFADYAKLPEKSLMTISPSAKRLAYRQTSETRDLLVVLDLEKSKVIRAIDVKNANPNGMYFIDDQRMILIASKNTSLMGYRGRYDVSVAFSFNIETGKLFQVMTAGDGIFEGQTALGRVVGISKDKRYAYMPAWKDKSYRNLMRVDLHKKNKPRRHQKGTSDAIDFFVDGDGQVLARERFNHKKNLHRLEALHDGDWVTIYRKETEIRQVGFVGVTPDHQHVVMERRDKEHKRWTYTTISLKDGAISQPVFSKKDRDVETVLTDINRVVYGVRYSGFIPSYEFFDEKLNKRMRGIAAVLPNSSVTINDFTPDWSTIVFHLSGNDNSGQYIRYHKGQLDLLANSRSNITSEFVNDVEITSYKARDGLEIPTLLTLPKNRKVENLPAIMLPHGGPESYDRVHFDWLAQYFASQGYFVMQPQFRGSKGFGPEHLMKGRGEWGRKMQDDLTDAVNEYVKQGKVDAQRVCIVGASYGGYAALAGAAFTPDVYKCAVSINGIADVERMLTTEKRDHGKDHSVVSYWQDVISNGNLDEDHLEKISPINSR